MQVSFRTLIKEAIDMTDKINIRKNNYNALPLLTQLAIFLRSELKAIMKTLVLSK